MYRVINYIKSKARVLCTESSGFARVILFYHLDRRVSEVHIESALTEICVPAEPVVVIISYASEALFAVGADCLIESPVGYRVIWLDREALHVQDVFLIHRHEQLEKEVLSELGLLVLKFHEENQTDFRKDLIEYITRNPNTFRMIFSPHNTGALRYKFFNMLEGIFRVIHTENSSAALNDVGLDYLSAYRTSGFMSVIGKWVSSSFSESEEFIIYMLKGFDESIQDHMTNFSKSKYNE